jgi:hypothetical protein
MRLKHSFLIFSALVAIGCVFYFYIWWFVPPTILPGHLEKVTESTAGQTDKDLCESLAVSPEDFALFFKLAKPLFSIEEHDYAWLPCYIQMKNGETAYRIRLGGLGEVWRRGKLEKVYHCRSVECEARFAFSSPRSELD